VKIGEIYRYSRPYDPKPETLDGLPNYFYHTHTPGQNIALLDSGINPIGKISAVDGTRCPAIIIASSPHKIGSAETPWQDYFNPDNGHIHYFGDNKFAGCDPTFSRGNKVLLDQFFAHTSPERELRINATPIIFFVRVRVGKRVKGNVKFQGFGTIAKAQLVTQYNRKNDQYFPNYAFDFVVFSLSAENEVFNWDWISSRRNAYLSSEECLKNAPNSWRKWIGDGPKAIDRCRRRVVKLLTYTSDEQMPSPGSKEAKTLQEIYSFYSRKKSRFESLAETIAARIIQEDGHSYHRGWISPESNDGGVDFVGRLDIGTDLARTKLVVLGQAKCEKLDSPTGGNHIARTVARLKRGWVGVYVTTSYFSVPVQREVLEDRFPIILVNGLRLAKEVLLLINEQGYPGVQEYLEELDRNHDSKIMQRDPEEILFE